MNAKNKNLIKITAAEMHDLLPNKSNRLHGVSKDTHSRRIKTIRENMEKFGFKKAFPIVLNEDLIICDGHHRAEAASQLNIGGWVLIDPDAKVEDYASMSSIQNRWNIKDYIKAKVNEGDKPAQIVEYLMDKFNFAPQLILRLEFGFSLTNQQIIEMINSYNFDFPTVKQIEDKCSHVAECQILIPVKQDKLKMAIAKMMQHEEYSKQRMVRKLKKRGGEIYPSGNMINYIEQLQKVYNYGAREKKTYFI